MSVKIVNVFAIIFQLTAFDDVKKVVLIPSEPTTSAFNL